MEAELLQIIGKPTAKEKAIMGVVTYFKESEQYGFMKTDIGDVFFHASRGYALSDNGTDIPGLSKPTLTTDGFLLIPPKRGSKILTIAQPSKKGLQAVRWVDCSDDIMQAVLDDILNRPNYEVVSTKGSKLDIGSAKVLWKGSNLDFLKERFPKTKYPLSDTFYITVNGERIIDEIR